MQRTFSVNRLRGSNSKPNLSKSPSVRGIYINEETSKKAVNTYFHSPFKEGKPNREYVNPSFVSTHLFYPKELLEKSEVLVRQNYIPHESEKRKQSLYRERIKTEANQYNMIKDKIQRNTRIVKDQLPAKVNRLAEPDQVLKQELSTLQNYREQLSHSRLKEREGNKPDSIPPYFEKRRKDNTHENMLLECKQKEMKDFIEQSNLERTLRREQIREEKQKQNRNVQRNLLEFSRDNECKQKLMKNKSSLLGTILKEQMLIRQKGRPV